MRSARLLVAAVAMACVCSAQAAKAPSVKEALEKAQQPVWSVRGTNDELKVSVSPAGRWIKLLPYGGGTLGTTVDIVVNDKYRAAIKEALGDYNLAKVVSERLAERLKEVGPSALTQIPPLGSTAGFHSDKDAENARVAALIKKGVDLLIDLRMDYGVYTENFDLRLSVEGKVLQLPKKRRLWRDTIPITVEPYLANVKFKNMLMEQVPFSHPPRLAVKKDAVAKLTEDDAAWFRARFEKAVDAGVSAVLCDLGLASDALGEYYLGRKAFQKKDYADAQKRFENALQLDPGMVDALNDWSVALARCKRSDKAIEVAKGILDQHSDYGPAAFNLAYWYALEMRDAAQAEKYYRQAISLGMPENGKIEKAIAKKNK